MTLSEGKSPARDENHTFRPGAIGKAVGLSYNSKGVA